MKKNIFLLLLIIVAGACSPRKNTVANRKVQAFYTYYNTLFNSKDALQTELKTRDKSHKDNFYAPYIQLLTYEEQPLGSDLGQSEMFSANQGIGSPNDYNPVAKNGATTLEIAEAKALKAIAKHSMKFDGVEKNKQIFDAHILLAQSRIYQGKPLEALDALDYIFRNMNKDKRIALAKIYQGFALSKMKDYYRANEVFLSLDNKKLSKEYRKLKTVYYSEMLLNSGKKEEAVAELDEAFKVNKNRKMRSRIAFLRGQILANLDKKEEARESFVTAYKYANNFEFEVKSQIEIAKTFNGNSDDYQGAKDYLEKIGKKGTYSSRKNEFLYALGLMANKAGKTDEAQDFFHKSLKEKMSDPQIRGLTFYEIGRNYFAKDDYIGAGAYYDSALAVMNYQPTKEALTELSENIKKVSKNYYLIKKNDSILALTKMPEAERNAYFAKFIDGIKAKEAKQLLEQKRAERSKGFEDTFSSNPLLASNNTNTFQDFGTSNSVGKFYFDNTATITKGQSDFRKIWGERSLSDNWRTSTKMNSIEDLKNEAMGVASAKDPRRLEPSFYIEKIPTDAKQIAGLKKDRDTASLGLGRMYNDFFSNRKLATKTLYDLIDTKPDDETKLQALYAIFSMNYEKFPTDAERAKQLILSDFPYTSYAEFVKNPKNTEFTKSSDEVTKMYVDAYDLYKNDKFEESKTLVNSALEKFPKDALVPKFALLNAFNAGKTAGKEIMILQLEQIALNYPKTLEGEKAREMLKYLKSELKVDLTDESGNLLPHNQPNQVEQPQQNVQQEQPQQIERGGIGVPRDIEDSARALKQKKKEIKQ